MNLQIKIFNTLSGKEEILRAIDPNHLKIYVCGPTVYDRPHLGNARSVVVYDLFFRFFSKVFPKVTYVRNITDVDDKINDAAKNQGISIKNLTKKITEFFHEDMAALNVLRPSFEPRATEHISEMIAMIEELIKNGHAYENQAHVLFDVSSYKNYGQLSNRNLDEMIAGARVEVAAYKKNPLDFVLWKPADAEDDISSIFESPWGKGRPGWHIECSAMSLKYLGSDFDIHGGGADLQFPHHENEIAQSRCAKPHSHFAHFWIHNGFLTVNGEKMSKSLKNFITVCDLLDQKKSAVAIRYLLLSSHYRKPLDFNEKALADATKTIEKFYSVLDGSIIAESLKTEVPQEVLEFLADDLNMAKVSAFLHEIVKEIKTNDDQNLRTCLKSSDCDERLAQSAALPLLDVCLNTPALRVSPTALSISSQRDFKQVLKYQLARSLDFLGLLDANFFSKKNYSTEISEEKINQAIELRLKFKAEKNFAKADEIRQNLLLQGVVLEDVSGRNTIWKRKTI